MSKINKILSVILSLTIIISTTAAFSVDAFAASKPSATSITKIEAKPKAFKVTYKKVKKITGYQIQYSTSSKFKSAKTVKVTKASTTSKTVSSLSAKKKYYVRVRTYKTSKKKTTYSKWSKAKSITTKSASSSGAIKITECSGIPSGIKVVWQPVSSDAMYYKNHKVKYQIQYAKSKDFKSAKTKTISCSSENIYSYYNIFSDDKGSGISTGKYYVRMRAVVDKKNKSWSSTKTVNVTNYKQELTNYAGK